MARNASRNLTPVEMVRADLARPLLTQGSEVTVEFTKRDGTDAVMRGTVVQIVGTADKEAVKMDTDKGFRSANLWSINKVTI